MPRRSPFRLFRPCLLALGLVLVAVSPLAAFEPDADQRATLERIAAHMADITTLEARFVQVSSTGNYAEGTVYIKRPWKMRIAYDPPTPVLIVADGNFLIYHDKELDQYSHVPLGLTPAGLLLKPDLSFFSDEVLLEGVTRVGETLEVAVRQADDPDAGLLTMVFSETPLELRQWRILDAQNVETTVSLYEPRFGIELDGDLFELAVPAGQWGQQNR
ncbi:LolA family protein [Roseospirillum parvum]|uniref:Outer membrane lipoprotein-sorting protein n=1 Tax=Roseospirillum parvum TaxID=83401 RepID=A0A1G8EKP8_9PROT|nr:outer membrane lipoprotein carrier protein LolA [Roseospirillum parvum]SDH70279.1 Outer membrane lipoprotein-sorting protein [Roseospirillum parvum]